MNAYAEQALTLRETLKLKLPPIAVCLMDNLPEGISTFNGLVPAGCVFWERAAQGAFATTTADHELCAIGVYTHSLADPSVRYAGELGDVLKVMAGMEYVREEDVAMIPVAARASRYAVYAPLAEAPLPPDVALLFANAQQGLIITEAVQQVEMGIPPALGRPACAVVPQALNTGRAALSLGCCGARAYLDALSDDTALWALPGAKLDAYATRIARLAAANATLGQFHQLRQADVAAGLTPTYAESLARLG